MSYKMIKQNTEAVLCRHQVHSVHYQHCKKSEEILRKNNPVVQEVEGFLGLVGSESALQKQYARENTIERIGRKLIMLDEKLLMLVEERLFKGVAAQRFVI